MVWFIPLMIYTYFWISYIRSWFYVFVILVVTGKWYFYLTNHLDCIWVTTLCLHLTKAFFYFAINFCAFCSFMFQARGCESPLRQLSLVMLFASGESSTWGKTDRVRTRGLLLSSCHTTTREVTRDVLLVWRREVPHLSLRAPPLHTRVPPPPPLHRETADRWDGAQTRTWLVTNSC